MEVKKEMELQEKIKVDNSKITPRLKDLESSDNVKFRSREDMLSDGVSEDDPCLYFIGKDFCVPEAAIEGINENGSDEIAVVEFDEDLEMYMQRQGYKGDSLKYGDEITIRTCHVEYIAPKVKVEKTKYSLRKKYTEDIIAEMISKIDKERIRTIFSAAASICLSGRKPTEVTNDIVDMYLDKWARAKVNYYMAFGNSLTISKKIEYEMDENEMSILLNGLINDYPKYALNLIRISPRDFVKNKMPDVREFHDYFKTYKPGMKVSKFLSSFDDKQFDDAVSAVMQERTVKGNLVISIDPYDYLTHAISMHGWGSCHSFVSEHKPTSSWEFMLDDVTLVAYKHNGKEYLYDKGMYRDGDSPRKFDFKKHSFTGNSKSFRQLICVDLDSASMIFSREYPKRTTSDDLRKEVRLMLEEQFASYLEAENLWDNYGDNLTKHGVESDRFFYSDISNYRSLRNSYGDTVKMDYVALGNSDISKAKIIEGKAKIFCLKCGKELRKNRLICDDCM